MKSNLQIYLKSIFTGIVISTIFLHYAEFNEVTSGPLEDHYLPGRIIVKFEPNSNKYLPEIADGEFMAGSETISQLQALYGHYQILTITPVFGTKALSKIEEFHQGLKKSAGQAIELAQALQHTYTITYQSDADPNLVAREIEKMDGVIYAEPHFTHQIAGTEYIPNDPLIGSDSHNYFDYHNLFRAWGISKGSSDVVIAIIDTGVYYDHPDLKGNLWANPQPGYADSIMEEFEIVNDTIGWNFWESGDIYRGEPPVQNANPVGNYSRHGTEVAGIAAAVTDNGEGMAGVGFQTQYMAVKVGGTKMYPNRVAFGYHGILYAALNGADVINCSFIGAGRSNFGAEVIAFAREMNAIVVAAIGNIRNNSISFSGAYPASFPDVLAVGAVSDSFDDKIAAFSNYGFLVDVFAVGENVLSTTFNYDESNMTWTPGYRSSSGTSLSTPIVSGLVALLRAKYPDWPPERITNQILGTARSIYHANPDPRYEDRLGRGAIDAYAALTEDISLISLKGFTFESDEGEKINIGETGTLSVKGIHYGSTSPDILFRLEPMQSGISLPINNLTLGSLEPGEQFDISFTVTINNEYRLDSVPSFRLTYSIDDEDDQVYTGSYIIEYERLLYEVLDNNKITASFPSDGSIGFMNPDGQSVGIGFIPAGHTNVLKEAGLMISGYRNAEKVVINQVRDSLDISRHFQPVKNMRLLRDRSIHNALLGNATFTSANHPIANELEIEMEVLSQNVSEVDRVIFLRYHITNNSDVIYDDMAFGLFNNWEIQEVGDHHTDFIEEENLFIVNHESPSPYIGIATLGGVSGALAINNRSGMTLDMAESRSDSLGFGIEYHEDDSEFDGFTDAEKYLALNAGIDHSKKTAEDLSSVLGTGPYKLYPQSSITIGFIYAWSFSLQHLREQVANARGTDFFEQYDKPGDYSRSGRVADELTLHPNYPNPFNDITNIRFDLSETTHVELIVYTLLGRRVTTLINEERGEGPHIIEFDASHLATGTYIVILKAGNSQVKFDTMMFIRS